MSAGRDISRREYLKLSAAAAAAIAVGGPAYALAFPGEDDASRDRRMKWWREARFGMFVHWGLYSIPAGVWNGTASPKPSAEWIMNDLKIPIGEYETLVPAFNPTKFVAAEWVRIAKNAGMKYLVITSKHHDGFALFDSKVSSYDVMATPYKRDLLKPLADECRKAGIRFCTYHSIMDWHHPDYLPRRAWDGRPVDAASFDRYVTYMKAQLEEIVSHYDPAVLWFDGEWESTWTHEHGVDLYDYVRKLNPDIIINNRVDKGRQGMAGMTREGSFRGDFGTPEQEIPPSGLPGVDWESCMTMNGTWGFRESDTRWKSRDVLIRNLVDIASKGGNFLLNVGPTGEGLIPAASVDRLRGIGAWMHINGEAIHGTSASPIGRPAWGRATRKAGKLYLHVFDWPKDGVLPVSFDGRVKRARLLAAPDIAVTIARTSGGITLKVPAMAPDAVASVVALDVEDAPVGARPR